MYGCFVTFPEKRRRNPIFFLSRFLSSSVRVVDILFLRVIGKPNQDGSEFSVASGKIKRSLCDFNPSYMYLKLLYQGES